MAAIRAVTISAFLRAEHTSHTEQFIVDALRESGQLFVSLTARLDGTVVGHVAISPASISDGATDWYGLGPLSVAPEYQRRGIGLRLVREALSVLRGRAASGCVLLGDPRYYNRFGFRVDPNLTLPGVPPDYFQTVAFGTIRPQGMVFYQPSISQQRLDSLWQIEDGVGKGSVAHGHVCKCPSMVPAARGNLSCYQRSTKALVIPK